MVREDPRQNFRPAPGTVVALCVPGGSGVQFDTMLFPGCDVPPFYDSLLGKVMAWDLTRGQALARMQGALAELQIEGVPTTAALHRALARNPDVMVGRVHTAWLESWLAGSQLGDTGEPKLDDAGERRTA